MVPVLLPVIALLPQCGLDLVQNLLQQNQLLVLLPYGVQVVTPIVLELCLKVADLGIQGFDLRRQ